MFQVEPILWMQSFESPGLNWIMSTVTALGYTYVYAALLIVLLFGIRLRESFFVFLAILVCGSLTDGLKDGLMFPRPTDVDIRVIEPGFERPPLLVESGAGKRFWDLPSEAAMESASIQNDWSYGLPSGHVALAAAFFLSMAYFFRSKGVFQFAICWIFFMALSRMYLGRHFIADVLGGLVVGLVSVVITALLVRPMLEREASSKGILSLSRLTLFVLILTVLVPFVRLLDCEDVGRMLGILATYALLFKLGMPSDEGSIWIRIGRVLLAIIVYVVVDRIINPIVDANNLEDFPLGFMLITALITFGSFTGTIVLARKLQLYRSERR